MDLDLPLFTGEAVQMKALVAATMNGPELVLWFACRLRDGYTWKEPLGIPLLLYKGGLSIKATVTMTAPPIPSVFELVVAAESFIPSINTTTNIYLISKRPGPQAASEGLPFGYRIELVNFTLITVIKAITPAEKIPVISHLLSLMEDIGFDIYAQYAKISVCAGCIGPLTMEAGPGLLVTINPGFLVDILDFYIFNRDVIWGKKLYVFQSITKYEINAQVYVNIELNLGISTIGIFLHSIFTDKEPAIYEQIISPFQLYLFCDGKAVINFFGLQTTFLLSLKMDMQVWFGFFGFKFSFIGFRFEFLVFFQVDGKLFDPTGFGGGFIATTKPGAKIPSLETIAATLSNEAAVKSSLAKCKQNKAKRNARLYGEPCTKCKRNTKVVPGPDFVYYIDPSKSTNSSSENEITYDTFNEYEPNPATNPKMKYRLVEKKGWTIRDCFGTIRSGNSRCKKSKRQARVTWNRVCKALGLMNTRPVCHNVGKGGKMELMTKPLIYDYKLDCKTEFAIRYELIDYCVERLYLAKKGTPHTIDTCYSFRDNEEVPAEALPWKKSIEESCSWRTATCEDFFIHCPLALREWKDLQIIPPLESCKEWLDEERNFKHKDWVREFWPDMDMSKFTK